MKNILLSILFVCASLHAAQLDWDDHHWGGTMLTNNFDGVGIRLSGDTGNLTSITIDANNTGGLHHPERGLRIAQDLSNVHQQLMIEIDFRTWGGADNVSFSIYNVDSRKNRYIDEVLVIGIRDGLEVLPYLHGSDHNNTVGALAYGTGYVNPHSGEGNVDVWFSDPVDSIMIRYRNLYNSPRGQDITIGDICYSRISVVPVVPEPSTWLCIALLSTLVIYHESKRRIQNADD